MTHRIFKQIATWLDDVDDIEITSFLDGETENKILSELFDLYRLGFQREMFQHIDTYNAERNSKNFLDEGNIKRIDADLPRGKQNNNMKDMMKKLMKKRAKNVI